MTHLSTESVSKVYHPGSPGEIQAVAEVSLEIPCGSFVLLRGPSGAGKSTLLALFGAIIRPTRGRVVFAGVDLGACAEGERARMRRRLGYIFQHGSLLTGLSAIENVAYPLIAQGVPRSERNRRANALLDRLGLGERTQARSEHLSGGEQQRVMAARALVGDPEVVLADEPTSQLDNAASDLVVELLREAHAGGKTVIVSSHDPQFVAQATRCVEMARGRVVTAPTTEPPSPRVATGG